MPKKRIFGLIAVFLKIKKKIILIFLILQLTSDANSSNFLPKAKAFQYFSLKTGQFMTTAINWKNPDGKISKYFSVREVTKNDPRRIPRSGSNVEREIIKLAIELDKIREEWGSPILVNSWYRPLEVNRAIGSSDDSQHIQGRAVDIRPISPDSLAKFQSWLDQNWFGALGYGAKKGFVHLDTRNNKGWRTGGKKGTRWNY